MTRASMRAALLRRVSLAALVATSAVGAQPVRKDAPPSREPYPGFDAYVEQALRTWKVPGVAVAIVRNDSVVHARGYGVREVGKPERVTERTLFAIGSASKAFTAAGIAMLVDERKVSWDAPAASYLPGFQLHDPYASRELTIRDILSHRSGLARGDLLWYGSELDRDEILRRTRFLAPSWGFRSQFGYQNLMYLAAGQVAARVSGKSWDDLTRERILLPLGMTGTSTSTKALAGLPDVASPHAEVDDAVRAVPWRNIDNIAPAGSINSHAVDMAQWVRLQLGRGTYDGRRLVTPRQMDEMHAPHTLIRTDSAARALNPSTHIRAYGLGWFLEDYEGRFLVHHGGNIDGMSALVAMLPEERLGVVILTNMNATQLPTVVARKLWDLHLKTPRARDWNVVLRRVTDSLQAQGRAAQRRAESQRVANTTPSLPLDQYAGVYADSMYGEVRVRAEGGALRIERGPAFQGALEHWHFDTFRSRWADATLGRTYVTFRLNAAGKPDELTMDMGGQLVAFRQRR